MGKLFCITGKSASGKDTLYRKLLARKDLMIDRVIPWTTRPMRDGERESEEYHFCTEEMLSQMEASGRVIERRTYHTVHGDWHYFTADDGQIDLENKNYLMIATPQAVIALKQHFGESSVEAFYIHVEDGERLFRALERERGQQTGHYAELCRRFLADEEDFSPAKLEAAGIVRTIENRDIEATEAELAEVLRKASAE